MVKRSEKSQIDKFRDKAREIGCDDDEKKFKAALGKIVRPKLSKLPSSERKNSHD